MPRTARRNVPGVAYHCIWRFVDRRWYLREDEERETYLRMLGRALSESDWRCFAYALMSSHIHLGMIAGQSHMQTWTRRVNGPYAQWLNRYHGGLGPVFAHRCNDYGFVAHRTGALIAYIHNNPVRAGVVEQPRDSTWTSHRAYAGLVEPPGWLRVGEGLKLAGFDDRALFDRWVAATPGERCDAEFTRSRRELHRLGAIEIGTPTADGDETMIPLVARPFAHVRVDPRNVIQRVADITAVEISLICSRRRLPVIRAARRAVVGAGMALGLTQSDIASALGISAQAVHKASRTQPTDMERRVIDIVVDQLDIHRWGRRKSA